MSERNIGTEKGKAYDKSSYF
ncbi:hypothetical protein CK5_17940 [Blautia obeum A2-162]|uniref:Uncharacterized protein n=1 Tax=Blautia obeum A2-162 TaxID=657314 RepID=D4LQY1_9FIRM|nr:hypothetical protein CK5_17940 [Blautia obeum A2-162]